MNQPGQEYTDNTKGDNLKKKLSKDKSKSTNVVSDAKRKTLNNLSKKNSSQVLKTHEKTTQSNKSTKQN